MLEYAEAVQKLTWSEMDRLATYMADAICMGAKEGVEIEPRYISQLIVDAADGIAKEAAAEETTE